MVRVLQKWMLVQNPSSAVPVVTTARHTIIRMESDWNASDSDKMMMSMASQELYSRDEC
jgi:hypothetical protein